MTEPEADAHSIALMRRIGVGEELAFAELVALHQHVVIASAYHLLGNSEDAQDVAQQTFLRIWKSAPRYEANAKFTTWMFTILKNLCFNEFRRRRTKPHVSLDAQKEEVGDSVPDRLTPAPDYALQEAELDAAIDAAIAQLPQQQRLAVTLRRVQELPYEEIAVILETSVSSVKSLLFRARQTLRDLMAGHLDA